MTTYRSRRAELRLHITYDEDLPGNFHDIPLLMQTWGLHKEPQECVWVVAYDAHMTVRTVTEVGRGTHTKSEVHIPTVLAAILTAGCERFMLVHNHPTKRLAPSMGDKRLTEQVMAAANACGLYFEDHIILTPDGRYYSFTDRGLLRPVDYVEYSGAAEEAADHFENMYG